MTFQTVEASRDAGRPIEFYEFLMGGVVWRYTSAETDIVLGGFTWEAAAIVCDNIKQTGEAVNDVVNIDVPSWIMPAQIFMTAAPSKSIAVTISAKHVSDAELVIFYRGEINQVNFPIPGRARVTCESLMSTMQREGLRLAWQRSCPYSLYDPLTCKVNKVTWKIDFVVLRINGFTIEVELITTQPNDHFTSGFLEWPHPIRGVEYLAIDTHTQIVSPPAGEPNARFVLMSAPGELFEGATGSAYPGCNFTPTNCQVFSNYANYGGVPDMPGKSPFDGDPVF